MFNNFSKTRRCFRFFGRARPAKRLLARFSTKRRPSVWRIRNGALFLLASTARNTTPRGALGACAQFLLYMADQTVTVSPMLYQDQERIRVNFPYDPPLIQKIRTVSGARWSPEQRCWHVPKTAEVWRQLKALFGDIQVVSAPATE